MPKNRRRYICLLAIVGFFFSLIACQPNLDITSSHTPVQIGDTTVDVVMHEGVTPGLTFFNLHDDENTSVAAALDVIREYGGRVIELKHSGIRRITFQLNDSSYEFDPNRIFSSPGRIATLDRFSQATDESVSAVGVFADEILQILKPTELDVLVTLHNTTQGTSSVFIYAPGGDNEKEAEMTYISEERDPNDYYFVTDREIYEQLKQMGQNVVLQDNKNATDDGSLSVWCAQHQVNYINIEAQKGHRRIQADMLRYVIEILNTDG